MNPLRETNKGLIVFLSGYMRLVQETSVMPVSCLWKDGRSCQQDQDKKQTKNWYCVVDARAGPSLKTTLKPKKVKTLSGNRIKSNQISKLQKEFKRHSKFDIETWEFKNNCLVFIFVWGWQMACTDHFFFHSFFKKEWKIDVDLVEIFASMKSWNFIVDFYVIKVLSAA